MENTTDCSTCAIYIYIIEYGRANRECRLAITMRAGELFKGFEKWCLVQEIEIPSMQLFGKIVASLVEEKIRDRLGVSYRFHVDSLQKATLSAKFRHEHQHRIGIQKRFIKVNKSPKQVKIVQLELDDKMPQFGSFLKSKLKQLDDMSKSGYPVDDLEVLVYRYMKEAFDGFFESQKGR